MKYLLHITYVIAALLLGHLSFGNEVSSNPTALDDAFGGKIVVTRSPGSGGSIHYSVKIFDTKDNQFKLPGDIGSVLLYVFDSNKRQIAFAPLEFHPRASSKEYDKEYTSFEFSINQEFEASSFVEIGISASIRQYHSRFALVKSKAQTDAEQGGTGQPATRSQSKSEGGDKPKPEAEGRSR